MTLSQKAADLIKAHNGNGGLHGAIDRCKAIVTRRAAEGKESPAAAELLAELTALLNTDHAALMLLARRMTGECC